MRRGRGGAGGRRAGGAGLVAVATAGLAAGRGARGPAPEGAPPPARRPPRGARPGARASPPDGGAHQEEEEEEEEGAAADSASGGGSSRSPSPASKGPESGARPEPPPAGRLERRPEEAAAGRKGKGLQMGRQTHLKPKSSYRKRDPPPYAPGSLEEQWHLAILDKGRVTCPVCRAAARKTVEGLKKHMANCHQETFTCHHCGKQLRSLAGMKYHLMADHNSLWTGKEAEPPEEQSERERLRQVLKRLGKLRCAREGCAGSFSSIMGYLYHTQKCGKAAAELETLASRCPHCGKAYQSKAGLVYHMKSEHGPAPFLHEDVQAAPSKDAGTEPSSGFRLQRKSAKVAAYHLHELAHVELAREWPKRKLLQDLVPDDRKLKYARPGVPAVSQEVLCKWRAEIKACRQVQCPNPGCTCAYSSVSGLKSHLGSCTQGEFVAGKYRCRLCPKEFVSESGVKYHINTVHAEDWFEVSAAAKRVGKRVSLPQREEPAKPKQQQQQQKKPLASCSRKRKPSPRAVSPKRPPRPGPSLNQHLGTKASRSRPPGSESWSTSEEVGVGPPPLKHTHKRGRK